MSEVIIITAAALVLSTLITTAAHKDYEMTELTDHWDIYTSDMQALDVSMKEVQFSKIRNDDTIRLLVTIPENTIIQPVLTLGISQSAVKVYLDDEEIYSYGQTEYEEGLLIGSGYCWIALPEDCSGRRLEIVLQKTAESSFNYMTEINIISARDAVYRLISEHLLAIILCIFLIIVGVMMFCSVIFISKIKLSPRVSVSLGLFAILMAFWISSNNKTIQLLVTDFHTIPKFEYLSFYFMPVAVTSYFYATFKGRFEKTVMRVLEISYIIAAGTTAILQFLNIRRLPESLLFFQCAMLVGLLFIMVVSLKTTMKETEAKDRIIQNGILIFFLFAFLETVAYILKRKFDITLPGMENMVLVGIVIFIVAAVAGGIQKIFEYTAKTVEQNTLFKMAYTDALTNINNRAKCEKILHGYRQSQKPVLIINMDLNFFKEVNDTYGHPQGDLLLVMFADLLETVFGPIGNVGRMGGDEFIVIMDAVWEERVEQKICELNEAVEKKNSDGTMPCMLSFAYGYSTNKEDVGISPWKVYAEADKKMYCCKQMQKQKLAKP
ncbi:MAG: GGDEF domain-containing protein [Lachnospiraceae bacterium]|nr:GGDEF domain-containing protein [Lachnospiraceae bacterium]